VRDFPRPSIPALRYTQASIQWVTLPGVRRPGRGVDHLRISSAKVKERVKLYTSPSGSSWPVLERALPLPFTGNMRQVVVQGPAEIPEDFTKQL